jgi:hypothetical protein
MYDTLSSYRCPLSAYVGRTAPKLLLDRLLLR